ncbi:MAG TPA: bifunctional phosphoserine phosphatase/homoserine phosphotransferase ThrH [Candidatus Lambdaproteobacteria bacterium]|jgi:phosphoserine/homoserine phosphotransferase|nr:bifunctional phosphoserine phosphatase/homoserine phosphotransferase ThrH [SAR324 cluster bacterium]HHZ77907.1 bifunctional phosphoserine phosphatase/homoserine phosphotransferase ThrH [Candidatus Lambdaproteobacteria bacterium]HIB46355.1 bifunctional phosphoserine phosphatase/homoserine phosphotransferase ThrH [Candidatus Lambdaproteobacteria bacterium]HIB94721.1 bifunctional phosphoserine phosphatase/homoserine phosphotransferase ThrH [Candidatus Lambdaproteobacteria bacterium]HIO83238.1 b
MFNTNKMTVTCLDLEGVLIPEIWEGLARLSKIDDLKLTTRDIADYDDLMRLRLKICDQHKLTLREIHQVVEQMEPLDGAFEFLSWLRKRNEVIILSDTFREFVEPLLHKLQYPTVFCHSLKLDDNLRIVDYCLRQKDQKRHAVKALKGLNYHTVAVGDSYNDISMLNEADHGVFFRPTKKIIVEYPHFPVTHEFEELKTALEEINN